MSTPNAQDLLAQLQQAGRLTNPHYARAFAAVPRERFLPDLPLERVYVDEAITTKVDAQGVAISSSSQPSMMLLMLDQLDLRPGHNVLEIGTGTGYNAAIMRYIVSQGGHVTSLEIDTEVARRAQRALHSAGTGDVLVVEGDGAAGYAPRAAYDRILCTAGIWDVPSAWIRQLKPDGVLVTPIQLDGFQVSARFSRSEQQSDQLISAQNLPCRFVYMQGIAAGPSLMQRVGSTDLRIISASLKRLDFVTLHMLLSGTDLEMHQLNVELSRHFWSHFVPYAVLNEPLGSTVTMYHIDADQSAYGMQGGAGLALFTPGSAAFLPDDGSGRVYSFAGADALLTLHALAEEWQAVGALGVRDLRLRLLPGAQMPTRPRVVHGRIYGRHEHYLHAWLQPRPTPS